MAVSQMPKLFEDLAKIDKSQVIPSKLLASGPYIDDFMKSFVCQRCGKCCEIGAVMVDWADIRAMAKELNINEHTFADKYTSKLNGRIAMVQPCPFYVIENKSCKIYGNGTRPKVCKLFPLNTVVCTDNQYHLGVRTVCESAKNGLKEFEEQVWNRGLEIK